MSTPDTSALPRLRRSQMREINQLAFDIATRDFASIRDRLLRELVEQATAGADLDALIAERRLALLRDGRGARG